MYRSSPYAVTSLATGGRLHSQGILAVRVAQHGAFVAPVPAAETGRAPRRDRAPEQGQVHVRVVEHDGRRPDLPVGQQYVGVPGRLTRDDVGVGNDEVGGDRPAAALLDPARRPGPRP